MCLNVLEHIEDHENTLRDFHAVLQPGGRLALLVPAMKALYGTLDMNLDHFRRYEREELRQMATAAGFTVEKIRFMNQPGVFAWWLNSRVLKRKILPTGQLNAVRWVMPILRSEEKRDPSFGMSLLVLARKNS